MVAKYHALGSNGNEEEKRGIANRIAVQVHNKEGSFSGRNRSSFFGLEWYVMSKHQRNEKIRMSLRDRNIREGLRMYARSNHPPVYKLFLEAQKGDIDYDGLDPLDDASIGTYTPDGLIVSDADAVPMDDVFNEGHRMPIDNEDSNGLSSLDTDSVTDAVVYSFSADESVVSGVDAVSFDDCVKKGRPVYLDDSPGSRVLGGTPSSNKGSRKDRATSRSDSHSRSRKRRKIENPAVLSSSIATPGKEDYDATTSNEAGNLWVGIHVVGV